MNMVEEGEKCKERGAQFLSTRANSRFRLPKSTFWNISRLDCRVVVAILQHPVANHLTLKPPAVLLQSITRTHLWFLNFTDRYVPTTHVEKENKTRWWLKNTNSVWNISGVNCYLSIFICWKTIPMKAWNRSRSRSAGFHMIYWGETWLVARTFWVQARNSQPWCRVFIHLYEENNLFLHDEVKVFMLNSWYGTASFNSHHLCRILFCYWLYDRAALLYPRWIHHGRSHAMYRERYHS